jgi:hypothetical protein
MPWLKKSLLYAIPIAVLNRMFFKSKVSEFLLESFASNTKPTIKKIREN